MHTKDSFPSAELYVLVTMASRPTEQKPHTPLSTMASVMVQPPAAVRKNATLWPPTVVAVELNMAQVPHLITQMAPFYAVAFLHTENGALAMGRLTGTSQATGHDMPHGQLTQWAFAFPNLQINRSGKYYLQISVYQNNPGVNGQLGDVVHLQDARTRVIHVRSGHTPTPELRKSR